MGKNNISKKSQRLRIYLASTAKDMILRSGIKEVTIRNIADEAGYAYATIYNHFESLDELLWLTRSIIIQDIADYMNKNSKGIPQNNTDLYNMFCDYADYFIMNPSAYSFLYFHSLNKDAKSTQSYVETDEHEENFAKAFEYLLTIKDKDEVETIIKIILYSIHGILTLYISQNDDFSIKNVREEIKKVFLHMLD